MLLFNLPGAQTVSALHYFNTSNVTIQLFQNVVCKGCYFHFNTSNVTIQLEALTATPAATVDFNTSNVTIQQQWTQ